MNSLEQLTLGELKAGILQWAEERNFFGEGGATYQGQYLKLVEEFGETCAGMARGNKDAIADGIGDTYVVLAVLEHLYSLRPDALGVVGHRNHGMFDTLSTHTTAGSLLFCMSYLTEDKGVITAFADAVMLLQHLAAHNDMNLVDCVRAAYAEIAPRKGRWHNGVFIKEAAL